MFPQPALSAPVPTNLCPAPRFPRRRAPSSAPAPRPQTRRQGLVSRGGQCVVLSGLAGHQAPDASLWPCGLSVRCCPHSRLRLLLSLVNLLCASAAALAEGGRGEGLPAGCGATGLCCSPRPETLGNQDGGRCPGGSRPGRAPPDAQQPGPPHLQCPRWAHVALLHFTGRPSPGRPVGVLGANGASPGA